MPTLSTLLSPRPILLLGSLLMISAGYRSVQAPAYASTQGSTASIAPTPAAETPAESTTRWPSRWGNNPDKPGTIIELDPADSLRPIHLSRFHQFRSTDIEYNDANQLAADIGIKTGFKFKPEAGGSFLFIPNPKNKSTPDLTKDTGKQSKSDLPDLAFKFVSATNPPSLPDASLPDEDHVELQRTWFTYRDPKQKTSDAEPLGTIVLLPGMFGTPDVIVDALENFWHHKGYAILRMRSHPSRFTQYMSIKVYPGKESDAAHLAAIVNDDRVAEGAYATKAALEYLHSKRPTLADKPTILVGMSGGAMMLPTVYAYAPDLYNAAVLIAGGADFLTIAIESNYKDWIDAIVFDFKPEAEEPRLYADTGKPTKAQLATLSELYLNDSKLDAYHTATEMSDIPVLMLHASTDQAVPASTGQLLYQQLNKPERWSYPLGHELIFAGLPTQVTRIDRWLSKELGIGQ